MIDVNPEKSEGFALESPLLRKFCLRHHFALQLALGTHFLIA